MSSNVFEQSLELDQGVGYGGRVFGYDHERHNFVTWGVDGDEITIHSIEHDDQETDHGPKAETRKLAEAFLADKNSQQYRTLLRSCKAGFGQP